MRANNRADCFCGKTVATKIDWQGAQLVTEWHEAKGWDIHRAVLESQKRAEERGVLGGSAGWCPDCGNPMRHASTGKEHVVNGSPVCP